MLVMVFGGGLDSVCGGESLAGQLLCRNNLALCFFFFLWLFNGWIKVLYRVYRVLDGGGKETYGLEIQVILW